MKTAFKRVALVAAAALAIGGISAVSANAGSTPTFTVGTSTVTTAAFTTGTYNALTFTAGSNDSYYTITSTGVGSVNYPSTPTPFGSGSSAAPTSTLSASGSSEIWSNGLGAIGTGSAFGGSETVVASAYSATAGTQTITVKGNSSSAVTLTITWAAAPSFSAAYSSAISASYADLTASTPVVPQTDDALVASKTGVAGQIAVTIKDGSNHLYTTATVTASVSGSGLVKFGSATSDGTQVGNAKVANTTSLTASSTYWIYVSGDGTAGTGTITISVTDGSTTTTLATKTVTFTGSVAAIKTQQNLYVLKAGGSTYAGTTPEADATSVGGSGTLVTLGTPALSVFTTDANGNKTNASGSYVKLVSSDSTVLTAGTCQAATGADAVIGEYNCQVNGTALAASGKTATVTAQASTDGGATWSVVGTPVTFTIGGAIASVSIATDAATYVAGSPLKIVATAKDSAGNLAYDQDASLFSATLTASTVLQGSATLPGTSAVTVINGVHTFTGFYAPVTSGSGTLTISGTDHTSAANAVSATAALSDPSSDASNAATDAANEATDAANAATDAANAAADSADAATAAAQDAGDKADAALAAVTALSQQVTTLLAKVAALSATLAKISKAISALPKK